MAVHALLGGGLGETVSDLDQAAGERFADGTNLLIANPYGAMYLFGYSAEITLKEAAYRSSAMLPTDPAGSGFGAANIWRKHRLGAQKTTGAIVPWAPDWESGHSVLFWADYLTHVRTKHARALSPATERALVAAAQTVHDWWLVSMRYRAGASLSIPPSDMIEGALSCFQAAAWLRAKAPLLR